MRVWRPRKVLGHAIGCIGADAVNPASGGGPTSYIWAMAGRAGIRTCAWLLALSFVVLLLERGVPHHCSPADHHDGPGTGDASLTLDCALCDLALPVFDPVAPALAPAAPCMGPRDFASPVSGVKHATVQRLPARGPPMA